MSLDRELRQVLEDSERIKSEAKSETQPHNWEIIGDCVVIPATEVNQAIVSERIP